MANAVLHTDGYVAQDGRGGWAFVATVDGSSHVARGALDGAASHLAEWIAARHALAWAEASLARGDTLELRTDSALVAKGLSSRRPEMSGEAAEHRAECRRALARLAQAGIRARVARVPREENVDADREARAGAEGA